MTRSIQIDPLTVTSLYVEVFCNDRRVGRATGFVIEHCNQNFLVTNWHVVTGLDANTSELLGDSAAEPDELRVTMHGTKLGSWGVVPIPLLGQNQCPLYITHQSDKDVDVVLVPISNLPAEIKSHPFDRDLANTDMRPEVAMTVSIIGFPFGKTSSGMFPIWKTGHLASDYDLDYDGKPACLVDATTRGGMSGSPVVVRMSGGFLNRNGDRIMGSSTTTLFLGAYSGRVHSDIEVGIVWKPNVIDEILAHNDL